MKILQEIRELLKQLSYSRIMGNKFRPIGMNIELTTACPLKCPQCYCSLEGGKHIPIDIAKKRLYEAAEIGVEHVELSGGETLCYPHLYELISFAKSVGILPSIAISGWGFSDKVLNKLIESGVEDIYVSLNASTEEINKLSRDGYDLAINALKIIKNHDFKNVYINWVMHSSSVSDFTNMIELAEKYNVSGIVIIEPRHTAEGCLKTYPSTDDIYMISKIVKEQNTGVELIVQHCFSQLLTISLHNKLWGNFNNGPYKGCTAGLYSYAIDVNGDFIPCRHISIHEKWNTTKDYWNNSMVLNNIREFEKYKLEPCNTCVYSQNCRHCISLKDIKQPQPYIGNENCNVYSKKT